MFTSLSDPILLVGTVKLEENQSFYDKSSVSLNDYFYRFKCSHRCQIHIFYIPCEITTFFLFQLLKVS